MKSVSKSHNFWHDFSAAIKEYWIEVGLLCIAMMALFWILTAFFNW